MWEHASVKPNPVIRLLLAWLVAFGLVVTPLHASFAVAPSGDTAMSMMDDMPCCPDDNESQHDPHKGKCPDCATMVCAVSLPAFGPETISVLHPLFAAARVMSVSAPDPDDVGWPPPAPPPRSLIHAA